MTSLANGSGSRPELAKPPDGLKDAAAATPAPPTDDETKPDAGLRSLDHYKRALPKWRYDLRQRTLPLIRWETPYLAWLQSKIRTPALDSYFAITANLGTHTFFMIGLPILFWCGNASFGKGLVHILASGVFFTGFIKDLFSLPRPLSPPLHRITMSGSAALEYGFPSTHSANAVSVAVYGVLCLRSPGNTFAPNTKLGLEILSYLYATSIIFGRLYCGMHGFLDVVIGSVLGATISILEWHLGPWFEAYTEQHSWAIVAFIIAIIILVRVHPEPADDCPCFDDSVAFAGCAIGLELGTWHFTRTSYAWEAVDGLVPFDLEALGWPAVIVRICFGVLMIFAWREAAKPVLLKTLPHLFRVIENAGLNLPRRFFTPASEYKNIPLRLRVDNVLPDIGDLPNLVTSLRHPKRGRSVSVGPQSAADAYETLAYRERRRRESMESNGSLRSKPSLADLKRTDQSPAANDRAAVSGMQQHGKPVLSKFEAMMGEGTVLVTPSEEYSAEPDFFVKQEDELGEKEMFAKLMKPRVRYDVEVVTKLVVYAGIAWFATEVNPVLFEVIGLGVGHLRQR